VRAHSHKTSRELDLCGKHVVITGASSGLGKALALEMAAQGARVTLMARRKEQLDSVAEQIVAAGGAAFAVATDVTSQESVTESTSRAVETFGPVDVLVANAGISPNNSARNLDIAVAEESMRINYFGVIYGMQAVLPSMIERGRGGVLVISSLAALRGIPTMAPYCASKSAVTAWIESLRPELNSLGIQTTVAHLGYIKTPMTEGNQEIMPFLVEVDDAARRLVEGMKKGKAEIRFPWQLVLLFKLAAALPGSLYDKLFFGTSSVSWGKAAGHAMRWVVGGLLFCLLAWLSLLVVSPSTAAMLGNIYAIALPIAALVMLPVSRRIAGSSKVPILIAVLSIPLAATISLAALLIKSF
jgi:short-subunit dehydrogenase